ncbi:MAG TPA: hypothetical protein VNJ28_05255 [Candidatus Limnocylindrales bacterium]|nr:hypothetical protein [Candidatus Limnocylindrales bacterium]
MSPAGRPADPRLGEELRAVAETKGHAVDNARRAIELLERALASGELEPTPALERMLDDLRIALDQAEGQKLGGKSAEAARFILRAIVREVGAG